MMLAGHETSGSTMTYVYRLLAENPAQEKRLHAELDAVLGGRAPTIEDLPNLPLTGQILDETMRLYPAAWSFTRAAVEKDRIGPFDIPKGANLVISPWVNHRLPRFWSSPETFDPDRFTPEAVNARDTYAHFPFGAGPHMCIGKHLALFEIRLAMATISQRYRIVPVDGSPMVISPAVTLSPDQYLVRVERRRPSGAAS
jgi:cytochrome P450